jgi:hypothetical protein
MNDDEHDDIDINHEGHEDREGYESPGSRHRIRALRGQDSCFTRCHSSSIC